MKSAIAITAELDDIATAVDELCAAISEKLPDLKHGVGLLFCDADFDGANATAEIKKRLGIDVAGMTTLATLAPEGRLDLSAVLLVLSAEDCDVAVVASPALDNGNHTEIIRDTFGKVAPQNGRKGLVFLLGPYGLPFSGDVYATLLTEVAPGVPLMGGIASDDYDYDRARVFLSGEEFKKSMVCVGISGNIDPLFAIYHTTSRFAERIRRVTRAEGNVVYEVGDETFVRYLEGFGLNVDVEDPLLAFTSYPMMFTRGQKGGTAVMRHIASLNHDDGSGIFLGNVPEGALANICLINKNNLADSCRASLQALLNAANDNGGNYSTIFCISCCGRATILGPDDQLEGQIISEMLPNGINLAGAYCLGEFCPSDVGQNSVTNDFHNCSITFCML